MQPRPGQWRCGCVVPFNRKKTMKFLDHLEEWLVTFLMGGATLIIFVAVVHRYLAGVSIPGLQDLSLIHI